jgi:excisionase family DNA binding protein
VIAKRYQHWQSLTNDTAAAILVLAEVLNKKPKHLLSVSEAAKQLGVRREKILTWIRLGKLPATNTATGSRPRYRISKAALKEFTTIEKPKRLRVPKIV